MKKKNLDKFIEQISDNVAEKIEEHLMKQHLFQVPKKNSIYHLKKMKEDFLESINKYRYPKYSIENIFEGNPVKSGIYLVRTETGKEYIGSWDGNCWDYVGFESCEDVNKYDTDFKQTCFKKRINEKILFYVCR